MAKYGLKLSDSHVNDGWGIDTYTKKSPSEDISYFLTDPIARLVLADFRSPFEVYEN